MGRSGVILAKRAENGGRGSGRRKREGLWELNSDEAKKASGPKGPQSPWKEFREETPGKKVKEPKGSR